MGGHLVEQQHPGAVGIEQPGMGQGDRDQHGLLLAGRAIGSRLVLAGHGHGQLVAVRAGQGALGGAVAAARSGQRGCQRVGLGRTAGLIGEGRAGKRRVGQAVECLAEPRHQPQPCLGNLGPGFGQLRLDRVEPLRVGLALFAQQAVAFAQRRFQLGGVAGVAGLERQHQPIQKAAARAGAFAEQPVHRRGQPADRQPFTQPHRRHIGAVDLDHAAIGALGPDAGAKDHRSVQFGADREAAVAMPGRNFGEGGAAQPAARGEQRQRLEHVGLARAVLANQQVEPGGPVEPGGAVVAKIGEGDPVETHGQGDKDGRRACHDKA